MTTLNVREMVTLRRMQQAGRIPWAQIIFNQLCTMSRIKQVVPTMSDNIWQILEKARVLMKSFALNTSLQQYNWTLSDIEKGIFEEEVARAPQIPRLRMPVKQDGPVMLLPVILMGRPIPRQAQPPVHHQQPRQTPRQECHLS